MIHIDDLKEKITKELSSFKKETNAIACSVLDKDGFIIYYEKDNSLDEEPFKKKMIKLFTTLETLKMINFYEKTEYISFEANLDEIDEDIKFYSNGFKILIKSITENLILITVFKLMENIDDVIPKFDAVIEKLSTHLNS
ncbi:MAG: hypothetical protein ACFFAH_08690 [Promethearchaeota archaeon]